MQYSYGYYWKLVQQLKKLGHEERQAEKLARAEVIRLSSLK